MDKFIENELIIDLETNDGGIIKAQVNAIFDNRNRNYIAVMPIEDEENNILLYRYNETYVNGNEGIELIEIISDMEFDVALSKFEDLVLVKR